MGYGEGPADEGLRTAWQAFCYRLASAGDQVFKAANPTDEFSRADAFRFLTQNLGQAFDLALETHDPEFPQIHCFTTPTMKLGGDVADFTYRQAWISGDHVYRLVGRRGSARWLNITIQGPRPSTIPGTDLPSLHEPFGDIPEANIFGHQIETDDDGRFELIVGGPERPANWLPSTPGSRKLFIREAFDAWSDTPTSLTIERIGMATPRPRANAARMIDAMSWAGEFLGDMMIDWPEHSWRSSRGLVDPEHPNRFPGLIANTSADEKRGRTAAHMIWALAPDQALIVELIDPDGFWLLNLGGVFGASYDFLYRPVSYTPSRSTVDQDGSVRFVLAPTDPGVHNWLDTQGFPAGNLTYRNLTSRRTPEFRTQLIGANEVMRHLPSGTTTVSPEERVEHLRQRYHGVKRRFHI
jgi:hypothetical protein